MIDVQLQPGIIAFTPKHLVIGEEFSKVRRVGFGELNEDRLGQHHRVTPFAGPDRLTNVVRAVPGEIQKAGQSFVA
jgi:hypothetical protein